MAFELLGGKSNHGCFNHFFKVVFSCLFLTLFLISRYYDGVNSDAMISTSSIISPLYVILYGMGSPIQNNIKSYFFAVLQSASLFGFSTWAACASRADDIDLSDTAYMVLGSGLGCVQAFAIIVALEASGSAAGSAAVLASVGYERQKDDVMLTSPSNSELKSTDA